MEVRVLLEQVIFGSEVAAALEVGQGEVASDLVYGKSNNVVGFFIAVEGEGDALDLHHHDYLRVEYELVVIVGVAIGIEDGVVVDCVGGVEL